MSALASTWPAPAAAPQSAPATLYPPCHSRDEDCALDADGQCTEPSCAVSHAGPPCSECHGRGFHKVTCSEVSDDETSLADWEAESAWKEEG